MGLRLLAVSNPCVPWPSAACRYPELPFQGCFRIGNTGGMLDNILASKLYRPGSVAYVSRSGGLSNELNNIIARTTDGVYEGVAIGGDRYPATTFLDHILRYENNPEVRARPVSTGRVDFDRLWQVKMIVLLGEVGGTLEHDVCEALSRGRITKPLVAWCTGTCADVFPYEVQFGHAGALANAQAETAAAKNAALLAAGAIVPSNFEEFASVIHATYKDLVTSGALVPRGEIEPPKVPLDYDWARKLGLIRRPAAFVSSITDERGEELSYAGMKVRFTACTRPGRRLIAPVADLQGLRGIHGHRRRPRPALVPPPPARLRVSLHRDGAHGDR